MYFLVYGSLFYSWILNYFSKDLGEKLYKILFIVLWLFLGLRYGQGTDYLAYCYIFNHISSLDDVIFNPNHLHSEIGFRFLCWIFNNDFVFFVFCISTFEMLMLYRFLNNYSDNKLLSLVLFFPTFYLVYYFSALREGIVIAIFIGFLLDDIISENWKRFVIIVFIASLIHSVALSLLLVPIFLKIKKRFHIGLIICSLIIGLVFSTGAFKNILVQLPVIGSAFGYYAQSASFSLLAFGERTITFLLLAFLFQDRTDEKLNNREDILFNIYTLSLIVYYFLSFSPNIASRTVCIFKVLETVLITYKINKINKLYVYIVIALTVLSSIMMFKNILSFIDQGEYKNINLWNYPYVTIFNQEDILYYRDSRLYDLID